VLLLWWVITFELSWLDSVWSVCAVVLVSTLHYIRVLEGGLNSNIQMWSPPCYEAITWNVAHICPVYVMGKERNSTTGMSPYHLAIGRRTRGLLAILKENWTGEEVLPLNHGKSTETFLGEMKNNLQVAIFFADKHMS